MKDDESLLFLLQYKHHNGNDLDRIHLPMDSARHDNVRVLPPLSFERPFDDPSMEPVPIVEPHLHTLANDYKEVLRSMFDHDKRLVSSDPCDSSPSSSATNLVDLELSPSDHDYHDGEDHQDGSTCSDSRENCHFLFDQIDQQRAFSTWPKQHPAATRKKPFPSFTDRFRPHQEKQWKAIFERLVQFKQKFGHCCVPCTYEDDRVLARWVKRQRYQYKKFTNNDPSATMTASRIEMLESIGFIWHSHAVVWQERFRELLHFKQEMGHCNVPSVYPENPALATWVKCQRRQYRRLMNGQYSSMTLDRINILNSVDFAF